MPKWGDKFPEYIRNFFKLSSMYELNKRLYSPEYTKIFDEGIVIPDRKTFDAKMSDVERIRYNIFSFLENTGRWFPNPALPQVISNEEAILLLGLSDESDLVLLRAIASGMAAVAEAKKTRLLQTLYAVEPFFSRFDNMNLDRGTTFITIFQNEIEKKMKEYSESSMIPMNNENYILNPSAITDLYNYLYTKIINGKPPQTAKQKSFMDYYNKIKDHVPGSKRIKPLYGSITSTTISGDKSIHYLSVRNNPSSIQRFAKAAITDAPLESVLSGRGLSVPTLSDVMFSLLLHDLNEDVKKKEERINLLLPYGGTVFEMPYDKAIEDSIEEYEKSGDSSSLGDEPASFLYDETFLPSLPSFSLKTRRAFARLLEEHGKYYREWANNYSIDKLLLKAQDFAMDQSTGIVRSTSPNHDEKYKKFARYVSPINVNYRLAELLELIQNKELAFTEERAKNYKIVLSKLQNLPAPWTGFGLGAFNSTNTLTDMLKWFREKIEWEQKAEAEAKLKTEAESKLKAEAEAKLKAEALEQANAQALEQEKLRKKAEEALQLKKELETQKKSEAERIKEKKAQEAENKKKDKLIADLQKQINQIQNKQKDSETQMLDMLKEGIKKAGENNNTFDEIKDLSSSIINIQNEQDKQRQAQEEKEKQNQLDKLKAQKEINQLLQANIDLKKQYEDLRRATTYETQNLTNQLEKSISALGSKIDNDTSSIKLSLNNMSNEQTNLVKQQNKIIDKQRDLETEQQGIKSDFKRYIAEEIAKAQTNIGGDITGKTKDIYEKLKGLSLNIRSQKEAQEFALDVVRTTINKDMSQIKTDMNEAIDIAVGKLQSKQDAEIAELHKIANTQKDKIIDIVNTMNKNKKVLGDTINNLRANSNSYSAELKKEIVRLAEKVNTDTADLNKRLDNADDNINNLGDKLDTTANDLVNRIDNYNKIMQSEADKKDKATKDNIQALSDNMNKKLQTNIEEITKLVKDSGVDLSNKIDSEKLARTTSMEEFKKSLTDLKQIQDKNKKILDIAIQQQGDLYDQKVKRVSEQIAKDLGLQGQHFQDKVDEITAKIVSNKVLLLNKLDEQKLAQEAKTQGIDKSIEAMKKNTDDKLSIIRKNITENATDVTNEMFDIKKALMEQWDDTDKKIIEQNNKIDDKIDALGQKQKAWIDTLSEKFVSASVNFEKYQKRGEEIIKASENAVTGANRLITNIRTDFKNIRDNVEDIKIKATIDRDQNQIDKNKIRANVSQNTTDIQNLRIQIDNKKVPQDETNIIDSRDSGLDISTNNKKAKLVLDTTDDKKVPQDETNIIDSRDSGLDISTNKKKTKLVPLSPVQEREDEDKKIKALVKPSLPPEARGNKTRIAKTKQSEKKREPTEEEKAKERRNKMLAYTKTQIDYSTKTTTDKKPEKKREPTEEEKAKERRNKMLAYTKTQKNLNKTHKKHNESIILNKEEDDNKDNISVSSSRSSKNNRPITIRGDKNNVTGYDVDSNSSSSRKSSIQEDDRIKIENRLLKGTLSGNKSHPKSPILNKKSDNNINADAEKYKQNNISHSSSSSHKSGDEDKENNINTNNIDVKDRGFNKINNIENINKKRDVHKPTYIPSYGDSMTYQGNTREKTTTGTNIQEDLLNDKRAGREDYYVGIGDKRRPVSRPSSLLIYGRATTQGRRF